MPYLEVRRHSKRDRPQQHLSTAGVLLARRVGEGLGPFDLVVTSPLARCVETAVAMGFAVTKTLTPLAGVDGLGEIFPHIAEVDWEVGGASLAQVMAAYPELRAFVAAQADIWRNIALSLPEEGRALLIVHGGAYLDGVAIYHGVDTATWGRCTSYCEGVRLSYQAGQVVAMESLRVA